VVQPWAPTDSRRVRVIEARTVTAVACAAFAAATDAAVLAVRARLIELGLPLPERPPHRPHLTLAAARMPPETLPGLLDVISEVAARHRPIDLPLTEVGRFGRAGALWLGSRDSVALPRLRDLQRDVDMALTDAGWPRAFGERSTGHGWVPHCTLATRLHPRQLRELQARVAETYSTIDAVVAAVSVILVGGSGDVGLVRLR
jgi:2'-5' RNA ligase